jgi:ABC-type Fe3+-hydroxamate transport system substrate-binding protein
VRLFISRPPILLGGALVLAVLLAACAEPPADPPSVVPDVVPDALPHGAGRIVSLVPSHTETLIALGAGERLVGIGSLDAPVPGREDLPRLGDAHSVSLESVAALEPDVVVVNGEQLAARLEPLGDLTRVEVLRTDRLADVFAAVERLAALGGRAASGERLVWTMRASLAAARERAARRSGPAPRVLVVVQRRPMYTAGAGSFVHELLEAVGAENVAGDLAAAWPVIAEESVVARAPTVILDSSAGETDTAEGRAALLASWARFDTLPAVRDGRVHILGPEGQPLFRAGPRLPEALALLERLLYEDER